MSDIAQWYKRVTDNNSVEVRRRDDPLRGSLWAPIKTYEDDSKESKEWIEKFLKENDFYEKLKQARENGSDRVTIYYDVIISPLSGRVLESQMINYLDEEVEELHAVIGNPAGRDFSSNKSCMDLLLKKGE